MAAVMARGGTDLRQVVRPDRGHEGEISTKSQALAGDQNALQELILGCNEQGMEMLRAGSHDGAFEQFKYAEAMLLANQDPNSISLLAVTCNNLGCYYKKVGKFHGALSYLRRALKMEVELNADQVTVAGTHLNLCATLSKLNKHRKAVQHALCALELMSKRITEAQSDVSSDDYAVLAIAYHHVAMERQYLEQWDQAATCFQTGFQAARRLLGENHPLSITLGTNCEAALKKAKAKKASKTTQRSARLSSQCPENADDRASPGLTDPLRGLPTIDSVGRATMAGGLIEDGAASNVRSEAADWVRSEEALWTSFAKKVLGTTTTMGSVSTMVATPSKSSATTGGLGVLDLIADDDGDEDPDADAADRSEGKQRKTIDWMMQSDEEVHDPLSALPLTSKLIKQIGNSNPPMPRACDMGMFGLTSLPRLTILKKTPLGQALEDHPEALMDIIDAEADAKLSVRSAANDFRPNRSMTRSSRTSRMVRRTGVFNSTQHRDRVMKDMAKRLAVKDGQQASSLAAQTLAAERIQTVWRQWSKYCIQNSEWMTITWICATMIQSHWRSYHVRRKRMDKYAVVLQRHFRGCLVRHVLRRHNAVVTIQRRAIGMITREKLRRLHLAATDIQRVTRGGLTRKKFRVHRAWKLGVIIAIQRLLRVWLAKRITAKMMQTAQSQYALVKAVTSMQKYWRGWAGRQKAKNARESYARRRIQHQAALRLQLMFRRHKARGKVENMRGKRLGEMDGAATYIRKVFIGQKVRKAFLNLRTEYKQATVYIVTIQRYMRGCVCRLKMWREAVRVEEEVWAAVFIQCLWRGYCGRVRWENCYETMWRREMQACVIQRNLRGWLARLRSTRAKKRIARAEFERARSRFRAAQRIQSLARGMAERKVVTAKRKRTAHAATQIQRIARGRALRANLWRQIVEHKTIVLQAAARRLLVRNRRYHLIAKVIHIQRMFRYWRNRPSDFRDQRLEKTRQKKANVILIQRTYREFRSRKEIKRIKSVP
jgi:tetratricopeptide (TPR) repeat protein